MRRFALGCVVVLIAGCSDEAEQPKRRPPKARARPAPTPAPAPPPARDPTPEPSTPSLEPAPPSQWWCLCYMREGAEAPEPVTACREQQTQCRKLEARVAKGSKTIIAGSMTHGCRSLTGHHPSDVAGTLEQWQPSKLPGAWVSEGVCQLQVVPASETDGAPEPEPEPEPEPGDPFALMRSELIGEFALGQGTANVRHSLGEPATRGAIEEMGATGEWEQSWDYPDGLTLTMSSGTYSGPQSIAGITIAAPSKLKTRRGVGVGDARESVERAYADVRARDEESGPESLVAGSIYGGLIFVFEDGAVVEVFLGAAAE